ncbi:MAG: hypothetical protein ACO3JG_13500 [Luteolibacter sp.]
MADIQGRFDKLTVVMARMGYTGAGNGFIPPAGHEDHADGMDALGRPEHGRMLAVRATAGMHRLASVEFRFFFTSPRDLATLAFRRPDSPTHEDRFPPELPHRAR